jgi:Uma2 family endonuclease
LHLLECALDYPTPKVHEAMIRPTILPEEPTVIYPESDGQPMAENTLQFQWIVTIKENLDLQFRGQRDVFVAGDLLWYPVEGEPTIRQAPDVMTAFGRPKGHRGSYRQWEEGGIAPQAAFEILSPGNRSGEMLRKFQFYEKYGVEEYYVYNPDTNVLEGWLRRDAQLAEIDDLQGWVSPRLGIRFELNPATLAIYRSSGEPFLSYLELASQLDLIRQEKEKERQEKEAALLLAERLATQLRALGIEPER